jgi:hypothetical protein
MEAPVLTKGDLRSPGAGRLIPHFWRHPFRSIPSEKSSPLVGEVACHRQAGGDSGISPAPTPSGFAGGTSPIKGEDLDTKDAASGVVEAAP